MSTKEVDKKRRVRTSQGKFRMIIRPLLLTSPDASAPATAATFSSRFLSTQLSRASLYVLACILSAFSMASLGVGKTTSAVVSGELAEVSGKVREVGLRL